MIVSPYLYRIECSCFVLETAIVGGGLTSGSQFLNVIHFSDAMSSYAGLLVIPVFAIIGLNGFSKGGSKEGSKKRSCDVFPATSSSA